MNKIGRPTESKKDNIIKVRADEKLMRLLDYCTQVSGLSKSEVVRISIEKYYEELRGE